MTIKGWPSSDKLEATGNGLQYATVNPMGSKRHGADVFAFQHVAVVGADAAETGTTQYIVKATGHIAKIGNIVRFTSGAAQYEFATVVYVEANYIHLGQKLDGLPTNGDTFDILRYALPELSGTSGATTVSFTTPQRAMVFKTRVDYSATPVTTAAYTELTASTSTAIYLLNIFDSSGYPIILATGGAGAESDLLYIPPGGFPGPTEVYIAAGTRLSIKAIGATASTGDLVLNATN